MTDQPDRLAQTRHDPMTGDDTKDADARNDPLRAAELALAASGTDFTGTVSDWFEPVNDGDESWVRHG